MSDMDPNLERHLRSTIDRMATQMLRMTAAFYCAGYDFAELCEAQKPPHERPSEEIAEAAIARARLRGIA